MTRTMRLAEDFDYELPPELIAQYPAAERSASRLLHLDGRTGALQRWRFRRPAGYCRAGRCAGVERHARHQGAAVREQRQAAGKVEVLVERVLDEHRRARAHAREQVAAGRRSMLSAARELTR